MNQLQQFQKTMSSLEIAELTGKDHRNVTRDIQEQLGKLEGGVIKFEQTYVHPQNGQTYKMYSLPKRESLILVSGYSVELRAKIIDRWDELEREANKPKSLEEMSLMVINGLTARIQEMTPKAEFFDTVANTEGKRKIGDASKELKLLTPNKLFERLRNDRILMKDNVPYQEYIEQGYFALNVTIKNGMTFSTPLVTNKGLIWLQKKYKHLTGATI